MTSSVTTAVAVFMGTSTAVVTIGKTIGTTIG